MSQRLQSLFALQPVKTFQSKAAVVELYDPPALSLKSSKDNEQGHKETQKTLFLEEASLYRILSYFCEPLFAKTVTLP